MKRAAAALLCHMRQLVRQQSLSFSRFRRILTCTENNVASYGISQRVDGLCRRSRFSAPVDAHMAEVITHALFHEAFSLRL
jgi:hypothetical protein